MLLHRLRRFAAFSALNPADLTTVAARVRLLSLPAGRWLVRPGRELAGSYFLDRGRVRLYEPDELVDAGSTRALHPLYPGARGVATLTAVDLLQVDIESLAGLFEASSEVLPLYESAWLTEGWESRFLGTHLMQRLQPCHWQRILRGLRAIELTAGAAVVSEGEPGDEFYVLCAGSAEVRAAGRCVARLQPGDFFGEDALITGGRRNASVIMVGDGSVRSLPEQLFRAVLLPLTVVPGGEEPPVLLDIGNARGRTDLQIPLAELRERVRELQPGAVYGVVGGNPGQRALAAFILSQRGFRIAQQVGAD